MKTNYSKCKEYEILLSLISAEAQGRDYDKNAISSLNTEELGRLYAFARNHDYEHLVGKAIYDGAILSDDVRSNGRDIILKLESSYNTAIMRYLLQNSELETVCNAFEDAGIDYVPLKGSVLREYYRNPPMRTSCDIDILVRNDDLDRAIKLLTQEYDFTLGEQWQHDVSLFSQSGVHLELHFELVVRDEKSKEALATVWDESHTEEGFKHKRAMSYEMFVLYHFVHMSKHFMNGGCGIRPFADLVVIRDHMKWDEDVLRRLLEQCGLFVFYEKCNLLCDAWFGEGSRDDFVSTLEEYILSGGTYGSLENTVKVSQARFGGRFKRILSRAFIKYSVLKYQYPILKKYKILFPFYQVKRWIDFLFREGAGKAKKEFDLGKNVSSEENAQAQRLLDGLGLSE